MIDAILESIEIQTNYPSKIGVKSIFLKRAEGPSELCGNWVFDTFAQASKKIIYNSWTAPSGEYLGAYDKHDFTVTFQDGYEYSGCICVSHYTYEYFNHCIAQHIKQFLNHLIDHEDEDSDEIWQWLKTYDLDTDTLGQDDADNFKMAMTHDDATE